MTGFFLSAPTAVPPPPGAELGLWNSSYHEWSAWDGTIWDLSHGASGLALQSGVRGLHMPPILRYASKAPSVAGSRWRGAVTDERTVFWPIRVFSDAGSQAWIDHNRRFWDTLTPEQTGIWSVVQPSGERRSLTVRFTEETDDADDISPELQGWALYGINLVAESPYWEGDPLARLFGPAASENYYGGSGGTGFGPPFVISAGASVGSASITNPGQVAAWHTWTVNGPTTLVTAGLNGHQITFPMALAAGQWITINTDPADQVARDQNGVDRSAQLTTVDFAQIPRGTEVPLQVTMIGTGSVECLITPHYYRAL